jgi:uncharacterized protein with HEPN domain
MRRDELYLLDIVQAADAIQRFVAGVPRERFLGDDMLRSAVLHKLTIIGEAAARLSADFRQRHAGIEWSDIVGFRNIAVHAYFAVDWAIVWVSATQEVPVLSGQVRDILAGEYPDVDLSALVDAQ